MARKFLNIESDLIFKVKLFKNFKLRCKTRYQQQFNDFFSFSGSGYEATEANFRNKIQIDYAIEKHQIYFNAELFRAIKPSRAPYFNQLRIILGSKWKNKLGELNYALAYERELNSLKALNYFFA